MTDLTDEAVKALLDGATPGPWLWEKEEYDEGRCWHLAPGVLILDADGGGPDGADEIDAANARLIAAAPTLATDLAAALEEIERLTKEADALRASLSKARDQGRDPDYCYDEEWEYTMAWAEWPDLMDSHDLTDPTPFYTLYKGPTKWVVRVPTDDDSEVRLFDSEDDARAALTRAQGDDLTEYKRKVAQMKKDFPNGI